MTDDFKNKIAVEEDDPEPEGRGVRLEDFVAYMPTHKYIFTPCREPWVATSVNNRLGPQPVYDKNGNQTTDGWC